MAHWKPQSFHSSVHTAEHTVVSWTSSAKNNVDTDGTVCFVLGFFYWTHLLVSPDALSQGLKSLFAWRHCPSAPLCCSLTGFREQTVATFILAPFRKVQIAWKTTKCAFQMSVSCIWTDCLLYWGEEVKVWITGEMNQWNLSLPPDTLSNLHMSSEML